MKVEDEMSRRNIYTNAVKDVIGNNPIVDQFDVEYTANFYGSAPDAFMTGTLLRKASTNSPLEIVVTGTRGRAFSNFDAPSQPLPSDTTPGSFEAIVFPKVADRLQPWSEKAVSSVGYRTTQFYDDKERFYDSCLPNLGESLAADGAQIRTKSSESTYLPTDFPNLALWCRADSEVYAQGTYVGPPRLVPIVPNNGDRIVLWKDLSGNNRHFRVSPLQASSAPIWTTSDSEFNNQPSIKWDNVNPEIPLTSSYTPATTDSAITAIIVYRVNERAPQNRPIHEKILSDDFGFYMGISGSNLWTTPVVPHVRAGANTLFSLPPFSSILPSETSSSYKLTSKNDLFIIHTAQLTTAHAEQFILGAPNGQASSAYSVIGGVSGSLYVGNKLTSDQEVKVSEIILYERKLDRYELARLHSYLAGRYFNSSYYSEYVPWHLLLSASAFSGYSHQPHGNLETDSKGFILMNCPKSGDSMIDDPSTNNSWTWSYPYESRYNPSRRNLRLDDVLGVANATHVMTPSTSSQVAGLDSNPQKLLTPKKINGIIPILPGKLSGPTVPSTFRNGYRLRPNDASGETFFLPDDENRDVDYGYSLLIPSDATAVKPDSFPVGEYVSSSMYQSDLTKFFFGFGDLNTITFYDQSGAYEEVEYKEVFNCRKYYFGTGSYTGSYYSATGSHFATLPSTSFLNGQVSINFGPFPSLSTYLSPLPDAGWKITESTHYNGDYYFSSSVPTIFTPTEGVRWKRNGEASNSSKIIRSEIPGSVNGFYSSIVFDVTSSFPWKLSYDRAIVQSGSNSSNYFETVILAKPGYPSKVSFTSFNTPPSIDGTPHPSAVDALERLDYVTSSSALETMERFMSDPLIPGEYRLAFRFHLVDTNSTGSSGRAFLDNVAISTIENNQVITRETSRTMGGNNYPEFRLYSVDDRLNPHSLEDGGQYTNQFYKSNIFGVSPVIRGWKYGLVSGFPIHSRAVFRRNKFGQFRDMLEQRPFTKFVYSGVNVFGNAVTPQRGPSRAGREFSQVGQVQESPVTVHFVKRRFEVNKRNIGKIFDEPVNPTMTTSQNLSTEVTSSLPYFDGVARHRTEGSFSPV